MRNDFEDRLARIECVVRKLLSKARWLEPAALHEYRNGKYQATWVDDLLGELGTSQLCENCTCLLTHEQPCHCTRDE